ncbi:MAG: hypothetical protein M1364_00450 [Candidatus Marsarchaeota archaeon]|jgi:hypothetical protein|nr:hypothetical protein [Candidatus Marsarchaeota archaeon]
MPTAFKNRSERLETLLDMQLTPAELEIAKTIESVIADDIDAAKVSEELINHCRGRGVDFLSDAFEKLKYEDITGKDLFEFYKFSDRDAEEMLENISYDSKIDKFRRLQ